MLTLFAIPKGYVGESRRLQRNALTSWRRIGDDVQVLLLGDEPGVAETAAEYGVEHVPGVAVNEFGTPLLDSAFARAEALARHPTLVYANADLIFPSSFGAAVAAVERVFARFMLVGRCYELDVPDELDAEALDALQSRTDGEFRGAEWLDYFVFPRGVVGALPPFAVGRPWWDRWMIWRARKLGLALVDLTADARVIHQRHGYGHVKEATGYRWHGPEGDANRSYVRLGQSLSLDDATHRLEAGVVARVQQPLDRRVRNALFMHDRAIPLYRAIRWLHRLGRRPDRGWPR